MLTLTPLLHNNETNIHTGSVVHICPRSVSCHSMPATATNSHKSPRRSGTTDHHLAQADLKTDYRADYRADYRSIIQANYQVATSPSHSRTSHRSINAAQVIPAGNVIVNIEIDRFISTIVNVWVDWVGGMVLLVCLRVMYELVGNNFLGGRQ